MAAKRFKYADLDQDSLKRLQTLEQETGTTIVAVEAIPQPARLDEDQLARLQALEKELGVVLVAYPS